MEIRSRTEGEAVVISLDGRLDAVSAGSVKKAAAEALAEGKIRIVFDLSGVPFIDSTGLGVLVAVLRGAIKSGGDVRLAGLRPQVQSILELTRLHRIFEIHPDASSAVRGL